MKKRTTPDVPAMTRSELVAALAGHQDISRLEAEQVLDTFFTVISETLAAGDRVELRGLGTFQVKNYGGYTGRNPATGERVEVESKVLPVFRVGRELRERLTLEPAARAPMAMIGREQRVAGQAGRSADRLSSTVQTGDRHQPAPSTLDEPDEDRGEEDTGAGDLL